jgi:hypothetical protein
MKKDVLLDAIFGKQVDKKMSLEDAYFLLKSRNLIAIGELAEQAISKESGINQCDPNTPNIDLVSGKQIKHATTRPIGNRPGWKASISTNTTAPILAVITESITLKQYFFYIPYSDFKNLSGTIAVNFYNDGTPGNSKWWNNEVKTFKELCKLAK